ncbi:hypothetical protein ACTHQN_06020 [Curtobacterium flaccumfaciens]|uniref:hypothetical protein n=1 Tax=Curtobacterium flaccumfaciens TaxID=2035 RepID=UPI003F7F0169
MQPIVHPTTIPLEVTHGRDVESWHSQRWLAEPVWNADFELRTLLEQFQVETRRSPGLRARLNRPLGAPKQITPLPPQPTGPGLDYVIALGRRSSVTRRAEGVALADLVFAHPRRDFSRRPHQHHHPIAQYAETVGDLVMCESRLERSFVLLADFTPAIVHIISQPVTVMFQVGAQIRWHTPDFCVLRYGAPPLVVDVKRPEQALVPRTQERHSLVAEALAAAGMHYLVWTGLAEQVVANLSLLSRAQTPISGDRRRFLRDAVVQWVVDTPRTFESLATALNREHSVPDLAARTFLRELIWQRELRIHMHRYLLPESEVWA